MSGINKVILMGNLTRDPQLRFTPNQMAVCDFSVATNRKFKAANGEMKEEVTFVECTAWAKTAELISKWFTKGKPILVEGRLKLDTWEDKNGGGKRSKLSVVVEAMHFVGGGAGAGGRGGDGGAGPGEMPPLEDMDQSMPERAAAGERGAPKSQPSPISSEKQFSDDDIPF